MEHPNCSLFVSNLKSVLFSKDMARNRINLTHTEIQVKLSTVFNNYVYYTQTLRQIWYSDYLGQAAFF